ncbi:hypothetical protein [Rhodococcoides fascians]|uniref:hypothetical protein n=1 Tax=Rhodococcoides fascians TaxID=1828 RepID=UPI00277DE010|nr:hypothetical protein [Rhodococcus fascians]MDQ0283753.1 hypothetical protein [Rhodococcus fascians]
MSYPNQPPPDDAYVVNDGEKFGSLETEAGIRSRLKNPAVLAYGKGQNNLWGSGGFLGFLTQGIFGIVGAAADFIGGILGIRNKANSADTKATTAINTANGAAQTVVNVKTEIIQLRTVFDIKSPTPLWTALNRTEWPSIPWSQAMEKQASTVVLGSHSHGENNGTTAASRTDSENLGTKTLTTSVTERTMLQTEQWFAFIVIPMDTPLSGLNFYARGTPTDLRTRVYLMAPTGDMTALTAESPNLAGLLVSATYTATPTTFDDAIVEAGSIIAVRFRANGSVTILGADYAVIEPPAGFYPRHIRASSAVAAGTVSPDSIAESSVTWTQGFVPYVAVGNNIIVEQPKRYWDDNFDRADSNAFGVGGYWGSNLSIGIRSNEVGYTSTSDGLSAMTYARPLTTDYQLHGLRIGTLPDPTKNQVAFSRMYFRCTQNRSTGLCVVWRQGLIGLQTVASQTFTNWVTPVPRTIALTDSIQAQQGEWVDEVFYPDRVLVFHNGVEIVRTDVPNSAVPYGPQRRYGALGFERTPFQNSPRVMDWFEGDITEAEAPAA